MSGWRLLVVLTLVIGAAFGPGGAADAQQPTCDGVPATITGAGAITGTNGNDVIVGSPGDDQIDALGGDDLICGVDGDDRIDGGDGDDEILGGSGNDLLFGGNGQDALQGKDSAGEGGADACDGGARADTARLCDRTISVP